uniref:Uncharacterized protein n=3 Tax=Timema TaxID=61471 RepID=A0A7R9G6W0_TIMSH|nr:unnamed protein product [Timema douglasi]CAD7269448.1 unnamed protein product [Timema shepardi]CAD7580895.1 unnamed protein product [Timema californicum]
MQSPISTASAARPLSAGNMSTRLSRARSTKRGSTSSSWPT